MNVMVMYYIEKCCVFKMKDNLEENDCLYF